MDELYPMMTSVKVRAESYKDWVCSVREILENKGNKKKGLLETLKCPGYYNSVITNPPCPFLIEILISTQSAFIPVLYNVTL